MFFCAPCGVRLGVVGNSPVLSALQEVQVMMSGPQGLLIADKGHICVAGGCYVSVHGCSPRYLLLSFLFTAGNEKAFKTKNTGTREHDDA